MNKKIRIQALKVMLSAKFSEGKVKIIDSERLEEFKTRLLNKIIEQHDKTSTILFIHG